MCTVVIEFYHSATLGPAIDIFISYIPQMTFFEYIVVAYTWWTYRKRSTISCIQVTFEHYIPHKHSVRPQCQDA